MTTTTNYKFRVTFYTYSPILKKEFINVEYHRSIADANLRAMALDWTIQSIEEVI